MFKYRGGHLFASRSTRAIRDSVRIGIEIVMSDEILIC